MKKKIILYARHLNAKGKVTPVDDLRPDCFRLSMDKFWNMSKVIYKHQNRLKVLKNRK